MEYVINFDVTSILFLAFKGDLSSLLFSSWGVLTKPKKMRRKNNKNKIINIGMR